MLGPLGLAAAACAAAPAAALARVCPDVAGLTAAVVAGSRATGLTATAILASLGYEMTTSSDRLAPGVLVGYRVDMIARFRWRRPRVPTVCGPRSHRRVR